MKVSKFWKTKLTFGKFEDAPKPSKSSGKFPILVSVFNFWKVQS
jgi:hypothetical protein